MDNIQLQAQVAQLITNGAPLSLQGPNNVEIRHVGSNISGNAISAFMDALFYSLVGLYCYDLGERTALRQYAHRRRATGLSLCVKHWRQHSIVDDVTAHRRPCLLYAHHKRRSSLSGGWAPCWLFFSNNRPDLSARDIAYRESSDGCLAHRKHIGSSKHNSSRRLTCT